MTILQADFKSKQVVSADSSDKKPVVGVAGDNATRTIRFLLEKDVDELPKGINLNSIAWEMQYENVNLQRGSVLPDSVSDKDGKLEIVFTIPASLAVAPGDCQIQLCGSDGDSKHWHLSPMTVQIGDFFEPDTIEETDPKYDLLNQISAKVSALEAASAGHLSKAQADSYYVTADRMNYKVAPNINGDMQRMEIGEGELFFVSDIRGRESCDYRMESTSNSNTAIEFNLEVNSAGSGMLIRRFPYQASGQTAALDRFLIEPYGDAQIKLLGADQCKKVIVFDTGFPFNENAFTLTGMHGMGLINGTWVKR